MDVFLEGRRVSLAAEDALGDGGEATVTRHGDLAIKIYRAPSKARAAKLAKLLVIANALPDSVVAPRALVRDKKGAVLGFAMRALGPDHAPLASLSRRSDRAASGLGSSEITALFLDVHTTLSAIHAAGAVVGDLNDMNEMFARGHVAFIDVDSFQIEGYGCDVATEAFLDPDAYGPNLAAPVLTESGAPRVFSAGTDWYAFAVLLFRSLTLVHPYGGIDPDLPTLPRRAAARRSVFSASVRYPSKVGYALEILSDDFATAMRRIFENGERGELPRALVEEYAAGLRRCETCNTAFPSERRRCPACAARAPTITVTTATECEAIDLLGARGPILAIAAAGEALYVVAHEGERLRLYAITRNGDWTADLGAASPMADIAIGPSVVAIARRGSGDLVVHSIGARGLGKAQTTTTEPSALGRAAFACAGDSLYRVARGVLLHCAIRGANFEERPIATVMIGQTWLAAGTTAEFALGASRLFGERKYFVIHGARRVDLEIPPLDPGEALLHEAAAVGDGAAALLRHTRAGGVDRVRTDVVTRLGAKRASYVAFADRRLAGSAIHGALFAGDRLLISTDRGLVRERLGDPGDATPIEETLFAATEPFVCEDAALAIFRGGVAVAHGDRVRLLKMTR